MAFSFTLHRKKTRPPTEQSSPLGKRQNSMFCLKTMYLWTRLLSRDMLKEILSDGQIVGTHKTSAAPCYRGADNIPGPLLSPTFALLKKPPNMAEIYGTRRLAEAKVSDNKMRDYFCSFMEPAVNRPNWFMK